MGEVTDGSSAGGEEDHEGRSIREDDPRQDEGRRPGPRGFFGRIFDALGNQEPAAAEGGGAGPDAAARAAANVANLRRMRVDDIMVPKAEIVSTPADVSRAELVDLFRKSGMTRLPVFSGSLDSPVGLIHLKDFALRYGFTDRPADFELQPLLRPLLFVPPSMLLSTLFQKMQADRMHMALVIDEYGGVDGLVTIEDVIEQVVGEIEDEHDTAEAPGVVPEGPGVWLAKATTPLDEFEELIGLKLADAEEEEEVDTLGGLVFMLAGHVPARGELVPHPDGHEFIVVDADPRRIKRVRLRLKPAASVS